MEARRSPAHAGRPEPPRRRRRRAAGRAGPDRVRLRPGRRHLRAPHRAALWRTSSATRVYWSTACAGRCTVRARLQIARPPDRHRPRGLDRRELEALTSTTRSLADLRIVVGQFGGLSALSRQLVQALRQRSATVAASDEPDARRPGGGRQPLRGPRLRRLRGHGRQRLDVHYYAVPQFESAGGRLLATGIARSSPRPGSPGSPGRTRHAVAGPARDPDAGRALVTLGEVQLSGRPHNVSGGMVSSPPSPTGPSRSPHRPALRSRRAPRRHLTVSDVTSICWCCGVVPWLSTRRAIRHPKIDGLSTSSSPSCDSSSAATPEA